MHTHTYRQIERHTQRHTHARMQRTHARTHAWSHARLCVCACVTHTHADMQTRRHTDTQTHKHTDTKIRTDTWTHGHKDTQTHTPHLCRWPSAGISVVRLLCETKRGQRKGIRQNTNRRAIKRRRQDVLCNTLQNTAALYSTLQRTYTMQHNSTHCNAMHLRHTLTHCDDMV